MAVKQWLVAIDIMDTLLYDPWREAILAATGLDEQELNARREPDVWLRFESGDISEKDYWEHLSEQGIVVDPEAYHNALRKGYRWLPGMRELCGQLKAAGVQVVLATNYPVWIEDLEKSMLSELGIPIYASCHLHVRKPSVDFFNCLATDYGVGYDSMVLIDDSPANTAALQQLGGIGVTHTHADTTRKQLKKLEILP